MPWYRVERCRVRSSEIELEAKSPTEAINRAQLQPDFMWEGDDDEDEEWSATVIKKYKILKIDKEAVDHATQIR
jgi:hypothetical protein